MNTKKTMTDKSLKQIEKITGGKLTLGRFLWAVRMAEELPQVEFAKLLGISRQQLCDIEHNRKAVSPSLAKHYAELLQYSAEQFIRLSLQDLVDKEGLGVTVNIKLTKPNKGKYLGKLSLAQA